MPDTEVTVGELLPSVGKLTAPIAVRLSKQMITLLSDQLYQSPLKAIEELVVNSFDADASSCHVLVPSAALGTDVGKLRTIVVYDDGIGMDDVGLTDLWHIGVSTKRTETVEKARRRNQIGKFGIGKLATYALANRITYITSVGDGRILGLSLRFTDFKSDHHVADKPVEMDVFEIQDNKLGDLLAISESLSAAGLDASRALSPNKSWTFVLLEELKDKASKLSPKRLNWVLRTAMPLAADFKLYLNGKEVVSSKEDYELICSFTIDELPLERLANLRKKTSLVWAIENRPRFTTEAVEPTMSRALVSDLFPSGIFGKVIVTKKALYAGKSADLTRSHGYFVRVRGRLIDEQDPLSGVVERSHETFNRFRADMEVDDLDGELTAPREGIGTGDMRIAMIHVLTEVFNEARVRYDEWNRKQTKPEETKKEPDRSYTSPRQVERPVADALIGAASEDAEEGSEADESWFYLNIPDDADTGAIAASLYNDKREPYQYGYESLGRDSRLVSFEPGQRRFVLNDDHPLVLNYKGDAQAHELLLDLAIAEALLEVYLREVDLSPHAIGEVLERRDSLFRSMAQEQLNSFAAIAANLRGSIASEHDLEIALVVAARALGFVATHVSGPDEPDGLARLRNYPSGEKKIILEAKSSGKVPSLGAIDFAGLSRHVNDHSAQGCLLVAPSYPGSTRDDDAAAARSAKELHISCWTVEQLARIVESIEHRDITTRQILDIVLTAFTPNEVSVAVDRLLLDPEVAPRELARALLRAFTVLEGMGLEDKVRSADMLHVAVANMGIRVKELDVRDALRALVAASQGSLTSLNNNRVQLNTSIEELERRVAPWLGNPASARRASTFRANADGSADLI